MRVGNMKRLTFEQDGREPRQMERVRQSYLNRMKDVAIIGAAIFTLGGFAGSIPTMQVGTPRVEQASAKPTGIPFISPDLRMAAAKDGVSPNASQVEINGRTLEVVRLDTRLAELDGQTARYREPETIPTQTGGRYSNSVAVPYEVRFIVTISPDAGTRMLDLEYLVPRSSNVSGRRNPGSSVDLTDFMNYVQRVSGQEMTRVNIIVETGRFNNNGVDTFFANAYIFPLNTQGVPITRRGNGEYIIYSASYYAQSGGGSVSLLVEPNNRDSLYALR